MANIAARLIDEREIDLGSILRILWARKFPLIFIIFIAALIGAINAVITPPVYQADALIQLEKRSSGGLALSAEMASLLNEQTPVSMAEIEIIRSRMVLGLVVNNLHLDQIAKPRRLPVIGDFLTRYSLPDPGFPWLSKYAWHDEKITLGNLDMPAHLLGASLILTLQEQGTYALSIDGRSVIGAVGETLHDEVSGLKLLVDVLEGRPGREFIIQQANFSDTIATLRGKLSISEKGRNSSILEFKIKDRDPVRAAQILEEITHVYLLQNLKRNTAEADSSLQFIISQLPGALEKMGQAETALNTFQAEQESIDLSFETRVLLEQAIEIETALNRLTLEEQELRKRFTESHPTYQALLENRGQLTEQLEAIRSKTGALPEIQQEMLRLTQELKVAQETFLQLQTRGQELKVIKAGTISNVRIIDTALPGTFPISPNKKNVVLTYLILGLVVGLGYTFLRAFQHRGIKSAEDVEALGVPIYATVPNVSIASQPKKSTDPIEILSLKDPTNLAVEALRSLRTSLHFGMLDAKNKICMITSSIPGEGKSFVSVNLATVLAQNSQKICLVDTDLRRGYLNRYFGNTRKDIGLSDFLSGQAPIEDIIRKEEKSGLHYIITGKFPPNPSELIMNERFAELVDYLNKNFDLSILDTPPILAVTDPIIVGKHTGMAMLVVRYNHTHLEQVRVALKKLEINKLKLTGAILNGDELKAKGYGNTSYQYHYDYKSRD